MSESAGELSNREETIVAWLRHAALGPEDRKDFWAWDAVGDFVYAAPPAAGLDVVLELLRRASEEEIGLVIAGPLEELVWYHGAALVDAIEHRASADPDFRAALGGIWISEGDLPPDILARIVDASGGGIQPLPRREEDVDVSRPDT